MSQFACCSRECEEYAQRLKHLSTIPTSLTSSTRALCFSLLLIESYIVHWPGAPSLIGNRLAGEEIKRTRVAYVVRWEFKPTAFRHGFGILAVFPSRYFPSSPQVVNASATFNHGFGSTAAFATQTSGATKPQIVFVVLKR